MGLQGYRVIWLGLGLGLGLGLWTYRIIRFRVNLRLKPLYNKL